MKQLLIVILVAAPPGNTGSKHAIQNKKATPLEVILKVRKAAALLADQGAAGLEIIRDRNAEFTWKDTYIFVVNCDADLVMANAAFPEREGGDIKQHTDYNGKQYGIELCQMARHPDGAWVEYVWPKPGGGKPSRKISYVLPVNGLPYQVGAGIYHETITIKALNQLIKAHQ